jgi:tripartite-type tricarboxylate transporter receptor subunit TctC
MAMVMAISSPAPAIGAGDRTAALDLIVPVAKNQGFDEYARLLAPYLSRRLGSPVRIVNRPGRAMAAGLEAVLDAPPDGRTLGLVSGPQILLSALAARDKANGRLARARVIARVDTAPLILLLNVSHPASDLAGLRRLKRPLNLGGGVGDSRLQFEAALHCRAAGIPCVFNGRFETPRAQVLAAIQGEIDAVLIRERSARRITRWSVLRALAVAGAERAQLYPGLAQLAPTGEDAQSAWWRTFAHDVRRLGRLVIAPPGIAVHRLKALRASFRDVLTNPRVVSAAGRAGRGIVFGAPGPVEIALRRRLKDAKSRTAVRALAGMVGVGGR